MRWEIGKANGPLITRTSKPIIIRRIHPKRRKALNYYTRVTIPPGWDLLIRAQWPAALINVERDCEVSSGREKKKPRPFHAGPRSFTDARHSSIGFPLESSGPSSGMTTTIGKPREFPPRSDPSFSVQRWISPLSFFFVLSFFLFFIRQSKERKKGKKEERVRAFERLVREIVASSPSSLLGIFSRRTFENREGTTWNHASLFSSLPLSRRKTFSLLHVSRASMESRFLKRSGMGETREIFNRNRLDRTIRPVGKIA